MYFRPHVRALESQIAYLKERLEKVEQEKREVEEAARVRENALLDRLLVKNNVAPIAEPLVSALPTEILTPYGAMGPDMQEAYKESFIKEEVEWLMNNDDAIDEGTARALAEQNYIYKHQVIK